MRHRRSQEEVELNVTAMLDMAFQLLAFFILTFKPPPVEGSIALRLPPAAPINAHGKEVARHVDRRPPCQGRGFADYQRALARREHRHDGRGDVPVQHLQDLGRPARSNLQDVNNPFRSSRPPVQCEAGGTAN